MKTKRSKACDISQPVKEKEERAQIGAIIENYLKSKYPNWDKDKLFYKE